MNAPKDTFAELTALDAKTLSKLTPNELRFLIWQRKWALTRRAKQTPPPGDWTEWGILAGRGFGKQISCDTKVPTTKGWVLNGDLKAGDEIFDEAGRPCTILEAHPITIPKKMFRVSFSDGTHIDADADHLWTTWTHQARKQYTRHKPNTNTWPEEWPHYVQPLFDCHGNITGATGPQVVNTQKIADTITQGKRGDLNHCIPTCGDLQYPQTELPIDPWLLGYWLGNGSTLCANVACHQDDVAAIKARYEQHGYSVKITSNKRDIYVSDLLVDLRALNVLDNKHCPTQYLQSAPEQRRALLAGLLDSDGHCTKASGYVEFRSTLEILALNVMELARSLGQKPVMTQSVAKLNGKAYGTKYRVTWRSTYQPFSLPRKAADWKPRASQGLRNRHRMITAVTPIEPRPSRCLTVSSLSALYLAGEAMVPTHNTLTGAQWLAGRAFRDKEALPRAVIAPTLNDVRYTCFEGPAGLLSVVPSEFILKDGYNKTNLILSFQTPYGVATVRGFSAEEPERMRGPQFADLWCFIAGTQVSTPYGLKAIEQLTPGDWVVTRKGPKRVAANSERLANTGTVTFSNGSKLVGTADHPVCTNSGWTKLNELNVGDSVCAINVMRRFFPAPETFAVSVASTWQPEGEQFVYCLKVEDEPEYFANGILVHNCDELAAWGQGEETWDMAMMGLRLGPHPRVVWTTTPKPKDLVRKLVEPKKGRIITNGSTYENRANLPDSFFEQLTQYEGTQLGRQELNGELIDAEEGGVIQRSWMKLWPSNKPLPSFDWIIVSMDTAFTEKTINKRTHEPDDSACSVWGIFWHDDKRNVLLLDCWAEKYGMPDLIKRAKKEMNVSYGDDDDRPLIKPLIGSDKLATSGRKPDILLIEDKGSGISLRQMLDREGISAYAYNPGRADKLTRLHMVSHIFARGQVWIPESENRKGKPKTWVEPLLAQLCSFTGTGSIKHDDYVDTISQALRLCMDKNLLSDVKRSKNNEHAEIKPPSVVVNPYAI